MSTLSTLEDMRRDDIKLARQEARLLRQRRHTLHLIRLHERVHVKPIKKHYWQPDCNRLFVTYSSEQSAELRALCGKKVRFLDLPTVEFKHRHEPFAEVIDLKRI